MHPLSLSFNQLVTSDRGFVVTGVVGPMTDIAGVGKGMKYQTAESRWAVQTIYGSRAPKQVRTGLPGNVNVSLSGRDFFGHAIMMMSFQ